ncbi:MAG: flagellar export protein FliJ [Limnohabitans sp.]|nr:MAG: flagellar export protein FliJ [Limnohabitans sp.]
MAAIRSFDLAIELATKRRDEAARRLAASQRSQAHAESQLKQLTDYVGETDARIVGQVGRSVSMEVLRHHYQFMSRLQEASRLQSDAVRGAQRHVDGARAALAKAEAAVMGLIKVRDARLAQLRQAQGRREQAVGDELATQLHMRNASENSEGARLWQ